MEKQKTASRILQAQLKIMLMMLAYILHSFCSYPPILLIYLFFIFEYFANVVFEMIWHK